MAIQTYVLARLPQTSVGTIVPRMMSMPPIDGVPFLTKWDCGPSSRISWPICFRRSRRMSQGPRRKLRTRAVTPARAVRTVM